MLSSSLPTAAIRLMRSPALERRRSRLLFLPPRLQGLGPWLFPSPITPPARLLTGSGILATAQLPILHSEVWLTSTMGQGQTQFSSPLVDRLEQTSSVVPITSW